MLTLDDTLRLTQERAGRYFGLQLEVNGNSGSITNKVGADYYVNFDNNRGGAYITEAALIEALGSAPRQERPNVPSTVPTPELTADADAVHARITGKAPQRPLEEKPGTPRSTMPYDEAVRCYVHQRLKRQGSTKR